MGFSSVDKVEAVTQHRVSPHSRLGDLDFGDHIQSGELAFFEHGRTRVGEQRPPQFEQCNLSSGYR